MVATMLTLLLERQESPTDQPPGDATQAGGRHGSGSSHGRAVAVIVGVQHTAAAFSGLWFWFRFWFRLWLWFWFRLASHTQPLFVRHLSADGRLRLCANTARGWAAQLST